MEDLLLEYRQLMTMTEGERTVSFFGFLGKDADADSGEVAPCMVGTDASFGQ